MRLVFRADASWQIGSGHVLRLSTLAQEAISRGYECHFVGCASELPWVEVYLKSLGFTSITKTEENFIGIGLDEILLIDSYQENVGGILKNSQNWKLVVRVIDDFTPNFPADLYIHQGLVLSEEKYGKNTFGGPDFILIRKEITKNESFEKSDEELDVLIVGGGSDPYGFVTALMEHFNEMAEDCTFHIFTNNALEIPPRVKTMIYPIGPELDRVASKADLVITTASSSSLEFVAREIPTLIVCATSNQKALYRQLGDFKCARQVGFLRDNRNWEFDMTSITAAIESREIREGLRSKSEGLIDLRGPGRVVTLIENHLAKENK